MMPILRMPTPLRTYTHGLAEVTVIGGSVGEALQDLLKNYPTLQPQLYNGDGNLRPFVNLFIGENNVRDLNGMDTPLGESERVVLIPSIAGGLEQSALPALTRHEILRYSRHLLIPERGLAGPRNLKRPSALTIGTGGFLSPLALYLPA